MVATVRCSEQGGLGIRYGVHARNATWLESPRSPPTCRWRSPFAVPAAMQPCRSVATLTTFTATGCRAAAGCMHGQLLACWQLCDRLTRPSTRVDTSCDAPRRSRPTPFRSRQTSLQWLADLGGRTGSTTSVTMNRIPSRFDYRSPASERCESPRYGAGSEEEIVPDCGGTAACCSVQR